MATAKYNVLSPDGIPIAPKPFASRKAAQAFIPLWCKRYERQGYYLTAQWEKIPLEELPYCLRIVPY